MLFEHTLLNGSAEESLILIFPFFLKDVYVFILYILIFFLSVRCFYLFAHGVTPEIAGTVIAYALIEYTINKMIL